MPIVLLVAGQINSGLDFQFAWMELCSSLRAHFFCIYFIHGLGFRICLGFQIGNGYKNILKTEYTFCNTYNAATECDISIEYGAMGKYILLVSHTLYPTSRGETISLLPKSVHCLSPSLQCHSYGNTSVGKKPGRQRYGGSKWESGGLQGPDSQPACI